MEQMVAGTLMRQVVVFGYLDANTTAEASPKIVGVGRVFDPAGGSQTRLHTHLTTT
jgi:hypothetical protein